MGAGQLSLPEQEMHTTAFWLHFPSTFLEALPNLSPVEIQNGLTGAGNVLRIVGALLLMSDIRNIGLSITKHTAGEVGENGKRHSELILSLLISSGEGNAQAIES